jgi:transcriptional regulator with XRE-family HTH domain
MEIPKEPKNFAERLMVLAGSDRTVDIAEWAGISYNTINNYINSGRLPSAEVLLKLHENRGVNIHWLLTGSGQPFSHQPQPTTTFSPVDMKDTTAARNTDGDLLIEVPAFTLRIKREPGTTTGLPDTINVPIPLVQAVKSEPTKDE